MIAKTQHGFFIPSLSSAEDQQPEQGHEPFKQAPDSPLLYMMSLLLISQMTAESVSKHVHFQLAPTLALHLAQV